MNFLFAKVTNDCNLSCPHCDILNEKKFHEEKFFDKIQQFDGEIMAFGGEPSLYKDRLLKLLSYEKVKYITTNLILLYDEYIPFYQNLKVATSWNLNRFTQYQYQQWLSNLEKLYENNISCIVLITMTEDLVNYEINNFMKFIMHWDRCYPAIEAVAFEYVINPNTTSNFFDQCDSWLVQVDQLWNKYQIHIINKITYDIFHWDKDCSNIYTLEPNGDMRRSCPHANKFIVREECLSCKYSEICSPCRLQQYCAFPKKLYEYRKVIHPL